MKKRRLIAILFGILALAWAGVLFFFSGQNAADSSSLSLDLARRMVKWFPFLGMGPADFEPILRKMAHFGIFAVEGFLTGTSLVNALGYGWGMGTAFGGCALMAVANEIHQMFSEGRSCEVRDMLIDSGGALTGVLVAALVSVIFRAAFGKRHRPKRPV